MMMKVTRLTLVALLATLLFACATPPSSNTTGGSFPVPVPTEKAACVSSTVAQSDAALGRSGCCSHHGGVCGCDASAGMERCCDGTNSPSCEC